jgi:hypothetical protein
VPPYAPYRLLSISKLFGKDDEEVGDWKGFVINSEGISGGREGGRGML